MQINRLTLFCFECGKLLAEVDNQNMIHPYRLLCIECFEKPVKK